jgi:hypothetical protein
VSTIKAQLLSKRRNRRNGRRNGRRRNFKKEKKRTSYLKNEISLF